MQGNCFNASTLEMFLFLLGGVTCTAARRFSGLLDIDVALDVLNLDT